MRRSALADSYLLDEGELRLRAVERADHPFLAELYATTRDDELSQVPWPSQEDRRAFLDLQFEAQRRHYEGHYPASDHRLILWRDQPVGRIWIDVSDREVAVLDMALLPSQRGRGIATMLLEELIADARRRSSSVRMCVQKLNPRPLTLLARLGFMAYEEDASNVWLRHPATEAAVA